MENIKVNDSPTWLKQRLLSNNMNPINNVVDLTNYSIIDMYTNTHINYLIDIDIKVNN